jgi:DNA polymerase-3 subunit delta
VKIEKRSIAQAVDRPDPDRRFYLFYGPDEEGSRALAQRLLSALGAEKFAISGSSVREDPASLADEAGAMALFGGPRAIWIEPAGEEIADGVTTLLNAGSIESPVVAIGGALRKSSGLLRLAEAHGRAGAIVSYAPEVGDAARMVVELGRAEGLSISPGVAGRLVATSGANRAIIAGELAKYALYLGAEPGMLRELDHATIDLLGCDSSESDLNKFGDMALSGNGRDLLDELERGAMADGDAVSVVKALLRRLAQLVPLRSRIDSGERPDAVMTSMGKTLFFRDKPAFERMLTRWDSARLAAIVERTATLEKDIMLSGEPPAAAVGEELVTIARAARARR